jgi:predicted aldo/keto reductase-like oxidoreductase
MRPPDDIQALWEKSGIRSKPVDLALRWVWNQPEVSLALSGMSTLEQVTENIEIADRSGPGTMNDQELELVNHVAKKYRELGFVGCTGCRYCMPCPQGVNIPQIFALYNQYFVEDRNDEVKSKYWEHITPESQAKRCARCGKCEELCPQQLSIRNILRSAVQIFEQPPPG